MEGLSLDDRIAIAWVDLGNTVSPGSTVIVRGHPHTSQQCFVKALEIDGHLAEAWTSFATTVNHGSTATIVGRRYTRQECFVRALELGHQSATPWIGLGVAMQPGSTVEIHGETFTDQKCFIEALEVDDRAFGAWANLGATVNAGSTVNVVGRDYSKQQCCLLAAEIDDRSALLWHNLGNTLSPDSAIVVRKKSYTQQQCYVKALEIDDRLAMPWGALGSMLDSKSTVTVHHRSYTAQECLVKALELDNSAFQLWTNLGNTVAPDSSVAVGGKSYTRQQCHQIVLEIDDNVAQAWVNLGASLSGKAQVTVRGQSYNQLQCHQRALEIDDRIAAAWINLGNAVDPTSKVTVRGQPYTRQQCFTNALNLDDRLVQAWLALGNTLKAGATAIVRDKQFTRQQCYLRALEIDETAPTWSNLGGTVDHGATVAVRGKTYTHQQCHVRALEIDDRQSHAWSNLGLTMSPISSVTIGNATYTQQQCYLKALEIDQRNPAAWSNLGNTVSTTVSVQGKSYTCQECYVKALQAGNDRVAFAWANLGRCLAASGLRVALANGISRDSVDCFIFACVLDPDEGQNLSLLADTIVGDAFTIELEGQRYTREMLYEKACAAKRPHHLADIAWRIRDGTADEYRASFSSPRHHWNAVRGLALFYCGLSLEDPSAERADYFVQMQLPCDMLEPNLPFWDDGKRADLLAAVVTYRFDELPTPSTNQTASCFKPVKEAALDSTCSPAWSQFTNDAEAHEAAEKARRHTSSKLTLPERQALLLYTAECKANRAGSFYAKLNSALVLVSEYVRSKKQLPRAVDGEDGPDDAVCDAWDIVHNSTEYFRYFFRGFAKLPQYFGMCYRGIPSSGFDASKYEKGSYVVWSPLTSASKDLTTAKKGFARGRGVVFYIQSSTVGRDMDGYSMFDGEAEVLFPPNTTLLVYDGPIVDDDDATLFYLVESLCRDPNAYSR